MSERSKNYTRIKTVTRIYNKETGKEVVGLCGCCIANRSHCGASGGVRISYQQINQVPTYSYLQVKEQ